MKSKKIISMALVFLMIFLNTLPVYAYDNSSTTGRVEEWNEITGGYIIQEPKAEDCEVYVRMAEVFTLKIPKKISLDGTNKNPIQQFGVTAKGDLDGNSKVTVTTDEKFYLKQNKKNDVLATVKNGGKTDIFKMVIKSENLIGPLEDVVYSYSFNGNVIVPTENETGGTNKLSSGAWSGTFKFYINYENENNNIENNQEETQKELAGYYAEDGVFTPWEEIDGITVADGVLTSAPKNLTNKLILSDEVIELGGGVFQFSQFKEIVIPNSLIKIGGGAFNDCSNLETLILPNTLETISNSCMRGVSKLTAINYKGTMEEWNNIPNKTDWSGSVTDYEGWNCGSPVEKVVCSDGEITLQHT